MDDKRIRKFAENVVAESWHADDRADHISIVEAAARALAAAVREEAIGRCEIAASEAQTYDWEALPEDQREAMTKETTYALGHAAGVLAAVQALRALKERKI